MQRKREGKRHLQEKRGKEICRETERGIERTAEKERKGEDCRENSRGLAE